MQIALAHWTVGHLVSTAGICSSNGPKWSTAGFGDRHSAKVNGALGQGVTSARYRREFFRVKTVLPILSHLKWSELKRLRPGKVWRFVTDAS
jgi:hypothetical protein